jgi:HK97 family phage major capsid protein
MATLKELVDEQTRIAAKLEQMNDDPQVTEDDDANLRDTLVARWKELEPQREKLTSDLDDLKMIARAASNPANTENGDGGQVRRTWDGTGPEFMRKMDPFADLENIRRNLIPTGELVSRALTAIEGHDKRALLPGNRGEEATRKAQSPGIARHMLLTGTDAYLEAFRTYLNDPEGEGQVARASLTTATAQAGFLLPYVLDTAIVLTNSGSTNPYRRVARVETTTSNAWQGVNSAGITSAWLNESAIAAEAGTAVGQIQIVPQKAAAWVTGSFEVMSDTDYAAQLPTLLADEKNIREENAFALGTGGTTGPNTGMPLGILLGLSATQRVTASGGTAVGAFGGGAGTGLNDVYALNAALGPRFRLADNVAWIANITTINRIRGLDQYGGGGFWANLNSDVPDRLLNKPIYESPSLASAGVGGAGSTALASGVAVFGDFSKFVIVDRIGSTMLFDPMVKSLGTGDAPSGRQGWFYYWRVGSGVAAQNAFRWMGNI